MTTLAQPCFNYGNCTPYPFGKLDGRLKEKKKNLCVVLVVPFLGPGERGARARLDLGKMKLPGPGA